MVLEVVGEVDVLTASYLLEAAVTELEAGCCALVLDLAGVSFCSARCIGTLVEVCRLGEGHGARVRISRASRTVRRTADLVQAHDVVAVPYHAERDACQQREARLWGDSAGCFPRAVDRAHSRN